MSVSQTKITKIGGSEQIVKIRPATIVAFEEHFKIPLAGMTTMEQLYWLAWDAETRANKGTEVTKLFEDWINDIEDVEDVEEGKAPPKKARTAF